MISICTRRSVSSPIKTGSPEFSRSRDIAEEREAVEFVSVGLGTFGPLPLLFVLTDLFLLYRNRRLNKGGRRGLDCCCCVGLVLLMVIGMGGLDGPSFDSPLRAEVAPTLLLLLFVVTLMASMPFLGSEPVLELLFVEEYVEE